MLMPVCSGDEGVAGLSCIRTLSASVCLPAGSHGGQLLLLRREAVREGFGAREAMAGVVPRGEMERRRMSAAMTGAGVYIAGRWWQ